jgi:hypothetical protein
MLRFEYNIKVEFHEVGWGMEWIALAQYWNRWRAVVNAVMKIRFPENAGKFFTI